MDAEQKISQQYTHGSLERAILAALEAAGKDPDHIGHADLAAVDEFHIGGRQATIDFAEQFAPRRGMRLLDIGCGIGGASRHFAQEHGCQVDGIDLTAEYVRVAELLSQRMGLAGRVSYQPASAFSLPFADGVFDGAYMLHVGMNIRDKAKVFAEVRRVLKPGGRFGIYDIMRESDGEFSYPLPWAASAETNFVEPATTYKRLLTQSRFEVFKERSRRQFAIEFLRQLRARVAQTGPSPLGLQILMGATAPQKIANMISLLDNGVIAPIEIIARAI
jgi:ubiquinone/menaquinone biosynthesis C-methylase UbiE